MFTFILRVLYETLKNFINFVTRGDDVDIGVGQIPDKLKDIHKLQSGIFIKNFYKYSNISEKIITRSSHVYIMCVI